MGHYLPGARLEAVERIQNSALYEEWSAKRAKVAKANGGDANTLLLYHGTGARRPHEVVSAAEGLDPRHSRGSGNFYGRATYLSVDPSYGLGTGAYAHRCAGSDGRRCQLLVVRLVAGAVKDYGTTVNAETRALVMPPVRSEGPPKLRFDTVKVGWGGSRGVRGLALGHTNGHRQGRRGAGAGERSAERGATHTNGLRPAAPRPVSPFALLRLPTT